MRYLFQGGKGVRGYGGQLEKHIVDFLNVTKKPESVIYRQAYLKPMGHLAQTTPGFIAHRIELGI